MSRSGDRHRRETPANNAMETVKFILFLLVLGALGYGGVLYLWGGGDGDYVEEASVTVDGSNEIVFTWLLEPEHRLRWIDGLESSRRDGYGRWDKGARLEEQVERDGHRIERTLEVVEFVEGRTLALATVEDGVAITYRFDLRAHNTGRSSRVTATVQAHYEGFWGKLLEPVLGPRILERVQRDLERLDTIDKIA